VGIYEDRSKDARELAHAMVKIGNLVGGVKRWLLFSDMSNLRIRLSGDALRG